MMKYIFLIVDNMSIHVKFVEIIILKKYFYAINLHEKFLIFLKYRGSTNVFEWVTSNGLSIFDILRKRN